ncbi:hypothetical protein FKM82_010330 [Ascaphus truei]
MYCICSQSSLNHSNSISSLPPSNLSGLTINSNTRGCIQRIVHPYERIRGKNMLPMRSLCKSAVSKQQITEAWMQCRGRAYV